MKYFISISCLLFLFSCHSKQEKEKTLFTLVTQESGIDFNNTLTPNDSINPYTFRNFYNGAGVGLADFNNDGFTDIFFAGNQVNNALYINQGNLKFKDITLYAGVASENVWTTGVSIADVNGDGWPDIYVCKSGERKGKNRHNELFIHTGDISADGQVKFVEKAKEYGLADLGLSTHAAFFDFDKDGDLDCYLLNNSYRSVGGYDLIPDQRNIRDPEGGNKLYRNDHISEEGELEAPRFKDISEAAGIYGSAIGFGLGVAIADVNEDNWPDIYVSNDFFEKDYLYINNQDGTFKENLEHHLNEISLGSMGADIADINNDGRPEIFVTEMLPHDPKRYKVKSQFEDWNKYSRNVNNGYYRQFGRNMLQLNLGKGVYTDISRMVNVDATDWSWGALIADFDSDGMKDIFVANGIPRDLLDQDYINFFSDARKVKEIIENPDKGMLGLIEKMPSEPLSNFLFKNKDSLQFEDKAEDWGLGHKSFSNGAAYADLDNDGDLDLVVNNLNGQAFVYRNNTSDLNPSLKSITVKLKGEGKNTKAIGSKIYAWAEGKCHYYEIYPQRGFMSTVDTKVTIGVGPVQRIDSIVVKWSRGTRSIIKNVDAAEGILTISEKNAESQYMMSAEPDVISLFERVTNKNVNFNHKESDYSDFDRESLLFSMNSRNGPALCKGDINNDGLEDFYIGGAIGQAGKLYVQKEDGGFRAIVIDSDIKYEETECLFFNADDDDLLDLYIGSGSSELGSNSTALIDRIYFNKNGTFVKSQQTLPTFNFENTSAVIDIDLEGDGDRDLIVGVYSRAYQYGLPTNTYLLENNGKGLFSNITKTNAPDFLNIGMTTDIAVADIDNDRDDDIVIVGDWMSPTIFLNSNGILEKQPVDSSLFGMWKVVKTADIDGDGDDDIILGNIGLNNQFTANIDQPMRLFVNDFDQNGRIEQVLTLYDNGQNVPLNMRGELIKQIPPVAKVLPDFKTYSISSIEDIFPESILSRSYVAEVRERRSGFIRNDGLGKLSFIAFPNEAQYSMMYAASIDDYNNDGNIDIILGGNDFAFKPQVGIQAGSYGVLLLGNVDDTFSASSHSRSGILEKGQIRNIIDLGNKIVFGKNNSNISMYRKRIK